MARQSFAEQQIPSSGSAAVPYPTHRELANGVMKHASDMFVGEILGAGGVGGVLSGIPFEPAMVEIFEPVAPLMQRRMPGSAGAININTITGAAAGTPIAVAVDDVAVPSWKVTLPVGLAPNGRTVTVVCYGFRDIGGSL